MPSVTRLIFKAFVFAFFAVIATVLLWQINRTPSFNSIKKKFRSSDMIVLDRHGQVVDQLRGEKQVRRLDWVPLDEMPPALVDAVVLSEDRRFFYHPGYEITGGKTITMQTVDLLKVSAPIALELKWTKHQILEAYLNLARFRIELQGVAAASYGLFDKAPGNLTRSESALIAALLRAPQASSQNVRDRACRILKAQEHGEDCALLSREHLSYLEKGYLIRPFMKLAPQFARRLLEHGGEAKGGMLPSTLDRGLQWMAAHSLQNHVGVSEDPLDGAAVVIENSTGQILAYVGSVRPLSELEPYDNAIAARAGGGVLKPFLYGKALDERIFTAASLFEDSPLNPPVAEKSYDPAKFPRPFRDLVTMRKALAANLNLPAMMALELLGTENFLRTLTDFGFSGLKEAFQYGPSLALGEADVKLIDLANAYRALANGGVWSPLKFYPAQLNDQRARQVLSPEAAFVVADVLSDAKTRPVDLPFWAAVKTGTSTVSGDQWALGFTERYTIGVWSSGPEIASVWKEIAAYLHMRETSQPPRRPAGLKQAKQEWFLSGTEPTLTAPALANIPDVEIQSRISYPIKDSLIDMNSRRTIRPGQQIYFQVVAPKPDHHLYLNGRRLGKARVLLPWDPQAGRFRLELRDSKGQVVDKVHFEVRGRRFALAE